MGAGAGAVGARFHRLGQGHRPLDGGEDHRHRHRRPVGDAPRSPAPHALGLPDLGGAAQGAGNEVESRAQRGAGAGKWRGQRVDQLVRLADQREWSHREQRRRDAQPGGQAERERLQGQRPADRRDTGGEPHQNVLPGVAQQQRQQGGDQACDPDAGQEDAGTGSPAPPGQEEIERAEEDDNSIHGIARRERDDQPRRRPHRQRARAHARLRRSSS